MGLLIAISFLWKSLFPRKMVIPGAFPNTLINNFFENDDFKGTQKRQMTITKLIDHNEAIKTNLDQAVARAKGMKTSVFVFLTFLFFSLVSAFIC
ncbi:MAG: hypothetical protein IPI54_14635 [Chitinophagaceae bacterium]|nr:hypothetical protein [Chitinophagaceae bacterium]